MFGELSTTKTMQLFFILGKVLKNLYPFDVRHTDRGLRSRMRQVSPWLVHVEKAMALLGMFHLVSSRQIFLFVLPSEDKVRQEFDPRVNEEFSRSLCHFQSQVTRSDPGRIEAVTWLNDLKADDLRVGILVRLNLKGFLSSKRRGQSQM